MNQPEKLCTEHIYILGRGHNGSTILDLILGSSKKIFGVGEFISLNNQFDARCSCGENTYDCEYWSKILKPHDATIFLNAYKNQKKYSQLKSLLFKNNKSIRQFKQDFDFIHHKILDNISSSIWLDSSKEHIRSYFLLKSINNIRVIYLLRNPIGELSSTYSRLKKGSPFHFRRKKLRLGIFIPMLISSYMWFFSQLYYYLLKMIFNKRILKLRYEDLIEKTIETLDTIHHFINVDLNDVKEIISGSKVLNNGHRIAGNSVRLRKDIKFDKNIGKSKKLPKKYILLTKIINWPFMIINKYPLLRSKKHV